MVSFTIVGLLLGPTFHHLGARAAVRRPFDGILARCEECAAVRRIPYLPTPRCCRSPIRRREPLIWLLSAVGMGGAAALVGWNWLLPAHAAFVGLTTILYVTDLDQKLIPNRVLYPGSIGVAVLLVAGALAMDRLGDLQRGAKAGAGYLAFLLVVVLASRGGFGMGDAKMSAVLGLMLGFWGWRVFSQGLFLTGIFGGVHAIWLVAVKKAGKGHEFPYGPAMILGSWVAIALGV